MEKRSLRAWAIEKLLKVINNGCFATKENAVQHMEERSLVEDEPYTLPKKKYQSNIRLEEYEGYKVIRFSPRHEASKTTLYIHGGAYVHEITPSHVRFCDNLCVKGNVSVVAPIYGLAPNHTWKDAYAFISSLYLNECEAGKPIIVMGDSAGGGLAAGFIQQLSQNNMKLPEKVCLLSPWVDITMPSDYSALEKVDPMLGVPGLIEMGRVWAGELDTKDPRVSPVYGDMSAFPNCMLFVGTREIFYPDVRRFHEILKQAKRPVGLVVGAGMNHVYPLYPISEANKALKIVLDFLDA